MGSRQLKSLSHHQRVAIDTNIFIYALENNLNFPDAGEIFRQLPKTKIPAIASVLVIAEAVTKLYELGDEADVREYLNFIKGGGLIKLININQQIALKAAEFRARYSIKMPDALHLATAVTNKCQLLITADKRFGKISLPDLEIVVL